MSQAAEQSAKDLEALLKLQQLQQLFQKTKQSQPPLPAKEPATPAAPGTAAVSVQPAASEPKVEAKAAAPPEPSTKLDARPAAQPAPPQPASQPPPPADPPAPPTEAPAPPPPTPPPPLPAAIPPQAAPPAPPREEQPPAPPQEEQPPAPPQEEQPPAPPQEEQPPPPQAASPQPAPAEPAPPQPALTENASAAAPAQPPAPEPAAPQPAAPEPAAAEPAQASKPPARSAPSSSDTPIRRRSRRRSYSRRRSRTRRRSRSRRDYGRGRRSRSRRGRRSRPSRPTPSPLKSRVRERFQEAKQAKQAAEQPAQPEPPKEPQVEPQKEEPSEEKAQPAEAQIPTNTAQAAKEIAERLAKQTQEAADKAAADNEAATQANKEAEAVMMAQQSQLQQQQMLWDPQQQMMQQQLVDPTQAYGQDPAMLQQAMLQQQALMQAQAYQQMGMSCGGCVGMGMDPTAYAAAMGNPYGAAQAMYMQQQADPRSAKQYGTVKVFNVEKGFGFVSCSSVQGDVFFLRSELPADLQALIEDRRLIGQPVAFDLSLGKDTRHRATNMQPCTMEMVHAAMQMAPQPQGTPIEGTIKSYSDRHGYGFISSASLTRDAQFKTAELPMDLQALGTQLIGRTIACHVHQLSDGKLKATHVSVKSAMGMGASHGCGQKHRGYVSIFDPVSRLGVISAPGVAHEVHFCETLGQNLAPGAEVNFSLQMLADGSVQGTDVVMGPPAPSLGNGLFSGAQTAGLVKNYNDLRGFGFISIPGGSQDVYFQRRDMDEASQTLLNWVGGQGLAGCTANLRLEALSDGRWHARNITLSEAGLNLWDGAALAGVVKAYYAPKAFGFLNVPASTAIDFMFQGADLASDLRSKLQQVGPEGMAGTLVWFRLRAQADGRWQAKEVCLSGDGNMAGGPEGARENKGAPKAFLKVEKKIIPGAELLGTLKAWNFERGYGFIGVEGQSSDVYFQPFDLTESLKQQFDLVGPESCGILPGAVLHFWLQQMPGTGRLRGRDVSVAPLGAPPSDASTVESAMSAARSVAEEELAQYHAQLEKQSVDVVFDGAELSGIIKTFNPGGDGKGFGFINADGDSSDLYFQTKDFRLDDQQRLAEPGFQLIGQRVWFWLEMLDGGRTGKWRAHDLSFSSEGGKRPADYTPADPSSAKRARVDGGPSPGRFFGMVKNFEDSFGVLNTSGLPDDVVFSREELPPGASVQPGQQVEFELVVDETKISAKNIKLI